MVGSIVSASLVWLAVAQTELLPNECDQRGPAPDESAWFATVKPEEPRIHFLKSRVMDSQLHLALNRLVVWPMGNRVTNWPGMMRERPRPSL